MSNDANNLLSKPQLAQKLNCNISAINFWLHKKRIPYKKVGRLVRFDPKEIEAWIQKRSVPEKSNLAKRAS